MTARRAGGFLARMALALAVLLPGCEPDTGTGRGGSTIDRDTFVATYVDLRRAALGSAGGTIDPADREDILSRHGVTEEQLLEFAEVHGADVDYMRVVWEDVERRLSGRDAPADSVG